MEINTPRNEPYIGRELLLHYDKMLVLCFDSLKLLPELSTKNVHKIGKLSDHQKMAIQVINQSLNLAASIRELIRQGYLFGGLVLERSFVERIMILLYLHENPKEIKVWNNGWNGNFSTPKPLKAPSLAKMTDIVGKGKFKGITDSYNDLIHGKPASLAHGLIVEDNGYRASPSKTNSNPHDCDRLCATIVPFLTVLLSMMEHHFPKSCDN